MESTENSNKKVKKAEKVEQFPSTKIIWENIMGNIKYIY